MTPANCPNCKSSDIVPYYPEGQEDSRLHAKCNNCAQIIKFTFSDPPAPVTFPPGALSMDDEESDTSIVQLKPRLTADFLATLADVVKVCGKDGDVGTVANFLFDLAEKPLPIDLVDLLLDRDIEIDSGRHAPEDFGHDDCWWCNEARRKGSS